MEAYNKAIISHLKYMFEIITKAQPNENLKPHIRALQELHGTQIEVTTKRNSLKIDEYSRRMLDKARAMLLEGRKFLYTHSYRRKLDANYNMGPFTSKLNRFRLLAHVYINLCSGGNRSRPVHSGIKIMYNTINKQICTSSVRMDEIIEILIARYNKIMDAVIIYERTDLDVTVSPHFYSAMSHLLTKNKIELDVTSNDVNVILSQMHLVHELMELHNQGGELSMQKLLFPPPITNVQVQTLCDSSRDLIDIIYGIEEITRYGSSKEALHAFCTNNILLQTTAFMVYTGPLDCRAYGLLSFLFSNLISLCTYALMSLHDHTQRSCYKTSANSFELLYEMYRNAEMLHMHMYFLINWKYRFCVNSQ